MATKTSQPSICLLMIAFCSVVHSFMDIEELRTITYGINIAKEPIIIPERQPETAMVVTSRHGQQYQCDYPSHLQQKQQQEEEEKLALETGVVELLRPLTDQPCLTKTKDWWTYELCYGKHIRQYHAEDGRPKGDIMYLGLYQSDFDWNNETLREDRVRSKLASGRYHSQYYTNGSKCDLTSQSRQTEVRFLCEGLEEDYLVRVDEPETCVYVITVHTPRLCAHPHLKSPTPTQPIPIVCAPLLTNHQYLKYQAHTQAVKLREEELAAQAKAEKEQRERALAEAVALQEDSGIEDDLTESLNSILKKSLGSDLKGKVVQPQPPPTGDTGVEKETADATAAATAAGGGAEWDWKDVKDLDTLEKLDHLMDPQGILSNMDMSHKGESAKTSKPSPPPDSAPTPPSDSDPTAPAPAHTSDSNGNNRGTPVQSNPQAAEVEAQDDRHKTEDSLDKSVAAELGRFEKEVKFLREKHAMTQKRIQQIQERVKKSVTSQFKDIIEEAEAEMGGEVNEDVALTQLAESLNSLMDKLENTETEMKDIDKEIHKMKGIGEDIGKDLGKETETEAASLQTKEEDGGEGELGSKVTGVQAPPNTRKATAAGKEQEGEAPLRVQVRNLSPDELRQAPGARDLPPDQQKQFDKSLRAELSKKGVDPDSVKVHLKIISSANSEDEEVFQVMSEEESSTFSSMIVAILGGSNEAVKEEKRQLTLEDSYNFVYSDDAHHATTDSSPTTDSTDSRPTDSETAADNVPTLPEHGL